MSMITKILAVSVSSFPLTCPTPDFISNPINQTRQPPFTFILVPNSHTLTLEFTKESSGFPVPTVHDFVGASIFNGPSNGTLSCQYRTVDGRLIFGTAHIFNPPLLTIGSFWQDHGLNRSTDCTNPNVNNCSFSFW